MHTDRNYLRSSKCIHSIAMLCMVAVVSMVPADSYADVAASGDVSPDTDPALPEFGGTVSGSLQVGIDDIGRLTIDGPSFTDPLVSEGGVIGVEKTGIGEVEIAGFTSEWTVNLNSGSSSALTIGQAGQASLSLVGGAKVDVVNDDGMGTITTGSTIVAEDFNSQGIVTIDGFGSLLNAGDLSVGFYGSATLDAFNRGSVRSTSAAIGAMNGSSGTARFSGLGTRWINEGDVEVGTIRGNADDENGRGVLGIYSEARVSIGVPDTSPANTAFGSGETNINELGRVELGGGTLLTYDLKNDGLMRGFGTIQATESFLIGVEGELRNAAATANLRERLYVADFADASTSIINNGTIESLGGEMEFEPPVENTLEIIARDAVMRFNGGLTNSAAGSLTLGGDTTIYLGVPSSGSGIHVLANSEATIVGDLVFTSGVLALTAGPAAGTLDVIGQIDLGASTILDLEYSAGVFAQAGDTYEILDSTQPISGAFANAPVDGDTVTDDKGNVWEVYYNSGASVWITATGLTAPLPTGDFDSDGDVDGADFLSWQMGGSLTSGPAGDLADWQNDYGSIIIPSTATTSAVPEPSTLALALLTLACCPRRRRQS